MNLSTKERNLKQIHSPCPTMEESSSHHESLETGSSSSTSSSSNVLDSHSQLWVQFAQANSVKSFCQSWLNLLCHLMPHVSGAIMFGHFLAITRVPYVAANWIGGLPLPNYAIMAVIVVIYLIGGCFMDALAMILLTIPILFPLVTAMGYDPIWFGVIIVLVAEMGAMTPPVGINVYVLSGIARDIPLEIIFKGALPFVLSVLTCVALLIAFPQIALLLPNLMK